jgi:hypothetical protein
MENGTFYTNCNTCKKESSVTLIQKEEGNIYCHQYCGTEAWESDVYYYLGCPKCRTKRKVMVSADKVYCGVCSENMSKQILDFKVNLLSKSFQKENPPKDEKISSTYFGVYNLLAGFVSSLVSVFLLSSEFGDMDVFKQSIWKLANFNQYFIPNLVLSLFLSGIILTVLYSFLKRFFEIIGYTLLFSLAIMGLLLIIGIAISPFIDQSALANEPEPTWKEILYNLGFLGFVMANIFYFKDYFTTGQRWVQIAFVTIVPSLLFFLHHKYTQSYTSNTFVKNTSSQNKAITQKESYKNKLIEKVKSYRFHQKTNYSEIIINYFQSHGYSHRPGDTLYRSEGYSSFPEQPKYVLKHGIFSKRLVAKLLKIPFNQMKNDCALNHEKMGQEYEKAYQIKENNPVYFQQVYEELLEEVNNLIQANQNQDPMDNLCNLHTGWCMWESYLISTGDASVASGYRGDTYEFSPKSNNPLTFATGTYCGATQNAVLLWIRPEDYYIEKIR